MHNPEAPAGAPDPSPQVLVVLRQIKIVRENSISVLPSECADLRVGWVPGLLPVERLMTGAEHSWTHLGVRFMSIRSRFSTSIPALRKLISRLSYQFPADAGAGRISFEPASQRE